jgi:leader peptidase (prepilin peptidase)/N-methyltransferase
MNRRADEPGQPVSTADGVTVAAAAAAGLLAGRAASRHTARLLAAPHPPARHPAASHPPAPQPAGPSPGDAPPGGRRTQWALILGTALACAVMALRFGPNPMLPAFCYLAGIGVPLAVIDTRYRRLPDALTLPSYPIALALLGVAALLLPGGGRQFLTAGLGLAVALAFFVLQVIIYPAGLGWGDVKLSGLLGLYLGWLGPGALAAGLFLGYLFAAVTGLGLIAARHASRKSHLAFGPFLLAGALAAVLLTG